MPKKSLVEIPDRNWLAQVCETPGLIIEVSDEYWNREQEQKQE